MKATTKAILEIIGDAGYVVTLNSPQQGIVVITGWDGSGETWQVTSDSELAAVAKLAQMLGFEDLD